MPQRRPPWFSENFVVLQGKYWSRREPFCLGPAVRPVLMTTLLCTKRRGLRLPLEMWEHVFSYLQRRDFVTA
eukprot:m.82808 g.82808  ORF g.82808 m.82808 type:complete len:72 (+) comp8277_c0_seq2:110-325(+)